MGLPKERRLQEFGSSRWTRQACIVSGFFRLTLAACLQAGGRGRVREINHSSFYCNYSALPLAKLNRLLIVEEEWLVKR
jgi:hypothetical protein